MKREVVTDLAQVFDYDPDTGRITLRYRNWLQKVYREGQEVGYVQARGYRVVTFMSRKIYAHRLAYFLMTGDWPAGLIDHINGDKSDNRWSNLRVCTNAENQLNRKPDTDSLHSVYKGVTRDRRRAVRPWVAQFRSERLGSYATELEAALAYDTHLALIGSDFARFNFPWGAVS